MQQKRCLLLQQKTLSSAATEEVSSGATEDISSVATKDISSVATEDMSSVAGPACPQEGRAPKVKKTHDLCFGINILGHLLSYDY